MVSGSCEVEVGSLNKEKILKQMPLLFLVWLLLSFTNAVMREKKIYIHENLELNHKNRSLADLRMR